MQTLRIGEKIGGYQLLRLVARGGMGAVYEALEIQLDRRVALKVIAPPNPDDHDAEELVTRFMQEARTLARVNHPNVITIYAIDTNQSVPFITMELVEGISFKELLQVSFLSTDLAVPLFIQMLEGLHSLHQNRVIHRDLKPHNIMVRADGQIKILDFGIAKPFDSGNFTQAGIVVGSLAYMAPEVKIGIPATERSDLWNLGAIFYECLTGRPLTKAINEKKGAKEIPYPEDSTVPFEMRAIIAQLCHPRPMERFAEAAQAIEELRRFQRSRPPLSNEIKKAFADKVNEILAMKRGETAESLLDEVAPVRAQRSSVSRVHEMSSAPRRRRDRNPNYVGIGGFALALFTLSLWWVNAPSPTSTPVVMAPEPTSEVTEEISPPIRFIPPPPTIAPVVQAPAPEPISTAEVKRLPLPKPKAKIESKRPKAKVAVVKPAPDRPEILKASDEFTLEFKKSRGLASVSNPPRMTWRRADHATSYEVQIAKSESFRSGVVMQKTTGTELVWREVRPGDHYWRVRALGNGKQSEFSSTGRLKVWLPAPRLQPGYRLQPEEGQSPTLTWEKIPLANRYVAQVGESRQLAQVAPQALTAAELALPAKSGKYYVRIATADANGQVSGAYSRVSAVEVAPQLEAPELRSPADGASAMARSGKVSVTFSWEKVARAQQYELEIASEDTFSQVIERIETKATAHLAKQLEVHQSAYWRVRAVDKEGPSAWSKPRHFRVRK